MYNYFDFPNIFILGYNLDVCGKKLEKRSVTLVRKIAFIMSQSVAKNTKNEKSTNFNLGRSISEKFSSLIIGQVNGEVCIKHHMLLPKIKATTSQRCRQLVRNYIIHHQSLTYLLVIYLLYWKKIVQNRIPDPFTMDMNIPAFPFNQCKICIFLYKEISRNIRGLDLTIYRLPKKRGSCIISTSEMENCSSYQVLASYLASCVSKIVHIMQKQKQHSI